MEVTSLLSLNQTLNTKLEINKEEEEGWGKEVTSLLSLRFSAQVNPRGKIDSLVSL